MKWCAAALLALAAAWACSTPPQLPGDRVIGSFAFETRPLPSEDGGCPFADEPGGVSSFVGTITSDSSTGAAYLVVGGFRHSGTLEGDQLDVASHTQAKLKGVCSGEAALSERIQARLVPEDLARVAGGCEELDGAVAPPRDGGADAGQLVALVCGTLSDEFTPNGDGGCACAVLYELAGRRQ
jgi:hypothetical protein